jgi:serine/threonine-protein kinase
MSLTAGARIGSYEIVSLVGQGGMGVVYRAHDTKLGRDVAIKVVLEAFLSDRERLVRFEREAKALAVLNHPNIATLYGMEEVNSRHFLVMEFVEGPTLGELITSAQPDTPGAPPNLKIDTAIGIALQIAEALEAAHERGIVHRDLKPANVKITPDEKVKVLDFGLAKAAAGSGSKDSGLHSLSIANSPTLTAMGTQAGMILGTASYMSPEQARGMSGDHRSDIFSFGVVLFEMLTGRQPFQGETVSDVLASVLAREPDLTALPSDLAPRLIELIKRCLDKHPRRRWQAIGDVRHELEVIAANPRKTDDAASAVALTAAALAAPRPLWRRVLPVAAAVLATAAVSAGVAWALRPSPPSAGITRFTVPYGDLGRTSLSRSGVAVSPDGRTIAYIANRQIYVRQIGDFESRPLTGASAPGLGGPSNPVFSPDGTEIAYWEFTDSTIRRAAIGGASSTVVHKTPSSSLGLTWSGAWIYFTSPEGVFRVAASGGGEPEIVIKRNPGLVRTRPQVLPDGRLLYSLAKRTSPESGDVGDWGTASVVVHKVGDETPTTLFERGNDPRYLPSGHIVYVLDGVLYARSFNLGQSTVGEPAPLVQGIHRSAGALGAGTWWYDVSATGTLIYQPGPVGAPADTKVTIAFFDRDGKANGLTIPPGPYQTPRHSPNGQRIAFGFEDERESSIWVYDLAGGGAARRLSFGGRDRLPAWASNSTDVIFQSDREGDRALYRQPWDGSGVAVRLTKPDAGAEHVALSASRDGSVLLFDEVTKAGVSLKVLALKDKSIATFGDVTSSTVPTGAVFSPDGTRIAYAYRARDGQRGTAIFVQPYPATGAKYQLSSSGEDGHHAVWSADGKELYYNPAPGAPYVALSITPAAASFFAPAAPLARSFVSLAPTSQRPFDGSRDPKRGLILGLMTDLNNASKPDRPENRIVVNWIEELKAKVK